MKRYRIVLWCIFILIFINVFTACTPPTPKSEDKGTKTFSQMSKSEIEEAAEKAVVTYMRKQCSTQGVYFSGYDIDDIGYRITDISIDGAAEEATVKGYISFSNDYGEKKTRKFDFDVVFDDGEYHVPYNRAYIE